VAAGSYVVRGPDRPRKRVNSRQPIELGMKMRLLAVPCVEGDQNAMQLRCVRPLRSRGDPAIGPGTLTVGRTYEALELEITPDRTSRVRVVDDSEEPTLWALESFEILDGSVAPSWHVELGQDGSILIGPKAWQRHTFWWDYFNDEPEAQAEYKRELATLGKPRASATRD